MHERAHVMIFGDEDAPFCVSFRQKREIARVLLTFCGIYNVMAPRAKRGDNRRGDVRVG